MTKTPNSQTLLPSNNGDRIANASSNGHKSAPSIPENSPSPESSQNSIAIEPPTHPQPKPESVQESWSHSARDLLDTMPRVWTRGLLYLLVFCTGVILPWAMIAQVDETGMARGRLEPRGKTNRLDAPVAGTVAAVKVKEGQVVQAGQVLMELDRSVPRSELQQAETRLEGQRNRLVQLESLQTQLATTVPTQRLQNQAQMAGQAAQANQIRQQLRANQEQLTLTQQLYEKDQERVKRFQQLREQGLIPGVQAEDAERNLIETQQRIERAQAEIEQTQTELEKQQSTSTKTLREGELVILESQRRSKELQVQILAAKAEIDQTLDQIQALKLQVEQRVVKAPIGGTIFQLLVKNPGSVLQLGSAVAEIAPQKMPFVLRAEMPSQNSGFLRVGMPVKMKFDAYPFQDYGVVSGKVRSVSPDSKLKETPQGQVEFFELEIALDRPYLQSGTRRIALTPGQTATAEVIVRQRRVIDYVLDPFRQLQKGGLKL